MGIAERKEREKEQRKNDIVDAAERVFFKKGAKSMKKNIVFGRF